MALLLLGWNVKASQIAFFLEGLDRHQGTRLFLASLDCYFLGCLFNPLFFAAPRRSLQKEKRMGGENVEVNALIAKKTVQNYRVPGLCLK